MWGASLAALAAHGESAGLGGSGPVLEPQNLLLPSVDREAPRGDVAWTLDLGLWLLENALPRGAEASASTPAIPWTLRVSCGPLVVSCGKEPSGLECLPCFRAVPGLTLTVRLSPPPPGAQTPRAAPHPLQTLP